MFQFLKELFNLFFASNTFEKGAALAYYSVFSLLPMLVLLLSIFGLFFGEKAISGEIFHQLKEIFGVKGANQIQDLIHNQHTNHNNWVTTIFGFVTLILSASGMFNQMQGAFNDIWQIPPSQTSGILAYITKHFTSFSILIILFFILLISTTFHSFLLRHSDHIPSHYSFIFWVEHLVSFLLIASSFTLMFLFLGDADFEWRACALGGLFTAGLFVIGKIGIGFYIGHTATISTFGSASILALIMIWVYYTSQIIFLGAAFVKVWSNSYN